MLAFVLSCSLQRSCRWTISCQVDEFLTTLLPRGRTRVDYLSELTDAQLDNRLASLPSAWLHSELCLQYTPIGSGSPPSSSAMAVDFCFCHSRASSNTTYRIGFFGFAEVSDTSDTSYTDTACSRCHWRPRLSVASYRLGSVLQSRHYTPVHCS